MIVGYDNNGDRVHISDYKDGPVFCPDGHQLVAKKGDIRAHHFAHKSGCECRFSCNKGEWHINMQDRASKEHQEVRLKVGEKLHIADTLVDNKVIEYQHSPISKEDVRDREHFYTSLGYTLVWVFDVSSWGYRISKSGSNVVLRRVRGPEFPLLASCTDKVVKILDFNKREMFVVTSQRGNILQGHLINMEDFDRIYLGISKTTNDIRPFHHPL